MDNQLFEMLKDRFDRQDEILGNIERNLSEHTKKDEVYWKKIDVQEGQLSLLKWLFGGTITTLAGSFAAWVIAHIKG